MTERRFADILFKQKTLRLADGAFTLFSSNLYARPEPIQARQCTPVRRVWGMG